MKRISFYLLLLMVAASFVMGCSNKSDTNENVFVPVDELVVSDDFNYQTARNVTIDLTVFTNSDEPIPGVSFEVFNADPRATGEAIAQGLTDADGRFDTVISLASYIKKVYVVGFMTTEEVNIVDNRIQKVYGGSFKQTKSGAYYSPAKGGPWSYLSGYTFNQSGVPSHPTAGYVTRDNLSASFLQRINATLPERIPLYDSHPDYFTSNVQANVKLDEACDVWVTFVTEGAGYRNSLGFFTYPQDNPPTSTSQINPHYIIMPNTSLVGSSGGMVSGDKVYLGQFPAGIMIGWFIVADGFMNGSSVNRNKPVYYSIPSLNPESATNLKKHTVMVYDSIEEKLLVGFEDLPRDNGSDEDFNDLVIYATANPIEAIDIDDVPPIDAPVDTDGDGVTDTFDDYPTDPELAYDNYTPTPTTWGTLAYEDLWPNKGDYDFNDMVIKYNINQITNAQNKVKKVSMKYKLMAIGARKANGFAVELPFSASNITSLSVSHPDPLFNMETSGSKAVMRFFNSTFDLIPQPTTFVNTEIGQPYYTPVEFTASFKLVTPVLPSTFNYQPPYNPFIYIDGNRGQEVHLPGYTPTGLVDATLFGTGDDDTIIGTKYYKTENNLPWAVNIASDWDYPIERAEITKAHLHFQNWAQSNGSSYQDWYLDLSGYRDTQFIYTH